jgi:hypothetical protein
LRYAFFNPRFSCFSLFDRRKMQQIAPQPAVKYVSACWFIQSAILTNFIRPVDPVLMLTTAFAQPICAATKPINSRFALPSTGGDLICATQVPSSANVKLLCLALGLTLICRIVVKGYSFSTLRFYVGSV